MGGAACSQYNPGHQKNQKPCHPPKPHHNCGKHHNQKCPAKHHKQQQPKHSSRGKTHKGKKTGSTIAWPNCTIRQAGNVIIAYCP